jgi:hypothetical protein
MQGTKLDSLEEVEKVMAQMQDYAESQSGETGIQVIGPSVLAPFAEAIVTLAKEIRVLRDQKTQEEVDI